MSVFATPSKTPFCAIIEAAQKFTQPRMRSHELWAATCYFRPDALRELLDGLLLHIRLTEVYVVYNYAEDYRYPGFSDELEELMRNYEARGVHVEFRRMKHPGGLFHSKAYALIQRNRAADNGLRDQFLLVTSGNLTRQGLGMDRGGSNFEISYDSTSKAQCQKFMDILHNAWESLVCDDCTREVQLTDDDLRINLLLDATYLCKWEGSLRQELSAVFRVSEESMRHVARTNPRLTEMGFEIKTNTLRRYYFEDRPGRPFPKRFLKNYTAKTLIGYWCPSTVWKIVEQECLNKFSDFDDWLMSITSDRELAEVSEKCKLDLAALRGIGVKIVENPMIALGNRIGKLRSNKIKKKRIYWMYESFRLPYDLENRDGLAELYESLIETLESKGWKNVVVRNLEIAIQSRDLGKLELNIEDRGKLLRHLGAQDEMDGEDDDDIDDGD